MQAFIFEFPDGTYGLCLKTRDWSKDFMTIRESLERSMEDRSGTVISNRLAEDCKPILRAIEGAIVRRLKELEPT